MSISRAVACAAMLTSAFVVFPGIARADARALAVGTILPTLESKSLAGDEVRLPSSEPGKPIVLVIGPTKQSSKSAAAWSHAFFNEYGKKVGVYGVALLDQVPGIVRGFATSDVKKSAPIAQEPHASNVLISTDKSYRPLIPPGDAANAVVIVTDAHDRITAVTRRPYDAETFAALRKALP